ncbi:MAG: Calx-beta domain-containing protein [Gemmataceae bacterium]
MITCPPAPRDGRHLSPGVWPDGNLYVTALGTDHILSFGNQAEAIFTISLSTPSSLPITVNFATADGTAVTDSDFMAITGTVSFSPGTTSRTIRVPILDDTITEQPESFYLNLSNPTGAGITDGQGIGTILDNDATKFFVVDDGSTDRTYRYGLPGNALGDSAMNSGNTAPRGAASNAAGDKVWVVDANKTVYVYSASGGLLGSWTAGGLHAQAQVEGIATNGTDVWLLDNKQDKVFKYAGAASRLSGSQSAASSFSLNSGNGNGKGIVTDGSSLWVVDDGSADKVFKYTLAGALSGSWAIDAANASPTGLTINPASVNDIWIVDSGTDRVYQYTAAAGRTSGSQSASATFALAAGNTNPQDIADPPPVDMALTPAALTGALKQLPATGLPAAATGGVPIVLSLPSLAERDAAFAVLAWESVHPSGGPWSNLLAGAALPPFLGVPARVEAVAPGGQGPANQPAPLARGNGQRFRSGSSPGSLVDGSLADDGPLTSALGTDSPSTGQGMTR